MKKIRFFAFVLILAVLGVGFVSFKVLSLSKDGDFSQRYRAVIAPEEQLSDVAEHLEQDGVISDAQVFEWYVDYRKWSLEAGTHDIPPYTSMKDIARILAFGTQLINEKSITIKEGWNKWQIGDYLEKEGFFTADAFVAAVDAYSPDRERFPLLKDLPDGVGVDGYLFPETYKVFASVTPEQVIDRMIMELHRRVSSEMITNAITRDLDFHEVMTLASMVEIEVRTEPSRKNVAQIFLNRLSLGMKLQSDTTVNYITGKGMTQPLFADTAIAHPYNTYFIPGLPPGPISNPSFMAIDAVLNPTDNDYFYFLTTDDGQVIYSLTGEEHLRNKARYLD